MRLSAKFIYIMTLALLFFNSTRAYSQSEVPLWSDFKGTFAEESINRLAGQGIVNGFSTIQFGPEEKISRLEFAVLIARVLGIHPVYPSGSSFSDIPLGTVEAGYIEAMAKLGMIGGERFEPESMVLRQDAAVLLHRALGGGVGRLSLIEKYIDSGHISPYAAESVAYVTGKGLMSGGDNCFYPLRGLTGAEASVLAARLLDSREGQALTAIPVISPRQAWLKMGETSQIGNLPAAGVFPFFTTVYGTDSPDVFEISPEGNSLSGKQPGKGTVTVNAGYNHYIVKTEVLTPQAGVKSSTGLAAGVNADGDPVKAIETELKAEYSIKQHALDSDFHLTEYKNHPGPVDGLISKSDTWTGFLRQQGRDIMVDLKEARAVTKISMEFSQNPEWGFFLPDYMKAEVSVDGIFWYHLGYVYNGVSPSETTPRDVNLVLSFPSVTARYVKVSFPVDVWVFARHLSIRGRAAGTEPVVLAHTRVTKNGGLSGNYLQVPGIKDILLVYTGEQSQQTLTAGDFLPMLAYHDRKGVVEGRMFDTMLFLPYQQMPCNRDSWDAYIDDLFAPGKQLWALEEAMARLNGVPGLQGKEKVILTIPYPDASQQDFGALETGKAPLSFSEKSTGREKALKDRFSAVQWYYDKLMIMWNSAGFKNLDLAGIYWYGEVIDNTVSGEIELVQNTARLVRGNGQNFFWIPYFGPKGYADWKAYGFTHVFLQPNYYAKENPQEDRMDMVSKLARRYGMGIELECDEGMLYSRYYYDLFYKQLEKAHQLGLDGDTTNAYYAGLIKGTLVTAARSNVPQIRGIYDDIYRWISGTYN